MSGDDQTPIFTEEFVQGTETPEARDIRHARLLEFMKKQLEDRAQELEKMRRRAGLSVDDLAKSMGYKGASSIQRYLTAEYDKAFRPEVARAFRMAFLGRGNPPITDEDLLFLLRHKTVEPGDPAWEVYEKGRRLNDASREIRPEPSALNKITARLPLIEGDAVVEMPRFMSQESLDALKAWLAHLANYADANLDLTRKTQYQHNPDDPTHGKRW